VNGEHSRGEARALRSGRASWGALIVSLAAALLFLGVYA
jgi:hypothetical protein